MSLYSLIRCVFIVGSLLAIIIIANRRKHRTVAIIVGVAILISALVIDFQFPIENSFISFKTAKQAFSYSNKGEIVDFVEGARSGLVIYRDDEEIGLCFLPKTENSRWKIHSAFLYNTVYNKNISVKNIDYNISIYQIKKTNDYYIAFDAWFVTKKPMVFDNKKSDFVCIERTYLGTNNRSYSFYGYVEYISNEYQIQVNGETIEIKIRENDFSNATSK